MDPRTLERADGTTVRLPERAVAQADPLRLVQLTGGAGSAAGVLSAAGMRIVGYIPHNTYIVAIEYAPLDTFHNNVATESYRPEITNTYAWISTSYYPSNPIKEDLMANAPEGMSAYSSRGACASGREPVRAFGLQGGFCGWRDQPGHGNEHDGHVVHGGGKLDQTSTFPAIGEQATTGKVGLAATASSGLPVTFTTNGGPAVITGGTNLSFTATGVVSIVASQAGDSTYNPAPDATNTFNVMKSTASVYLENLSQVFDGTARSVTATTMPAGLTVEFTYDGNAWAPTNAGSYAVTGTVNEANWAGSADGMLAVSKASQSIAGFLPTNGSVFLVTDVPGLSATASSGLSVSFTTNSGPGVITGITNLSFTAGGEVAIVAAQVGDANWNPAHELTNVYTVLGFAEVTIASAHGSTIPVTGVYTMLVGTVYTKQVQTPDTQGTTQYVSTGWAMTGNEPAAGVGTQVVMTVTNDATLTWLWTTNYQLTTAAGAHGSILPATGWRAYGSNVEITATADLYYHFTTWTDDASGDANPLIVTMSGPKWITANFLENLTTNKSTPEWWLARYGITSNFEEAVTNDADGDGVPTGDEYVMNTDPTNALSFLYAAQFGVAYGTNCHDVVTTNSEPPYDVWTQIVCDVVGQLLGWPCATDRVYDIEFDATFPLGGWAPAPGLTNLGCADGWLSLTNALSADALKMYRLKVRLP
ncbi:MAG TPA: hypothetical protein DCZ95_09180 [Verrucomicrobia bacterium]|nr:hypothetical protein [Verrucomicrobiota bacterium]